MSLTPHTRTNETMGYETKQCSTAQLSDGNKYPCETMPNGFHLQTYCSTYAYALPRHSTLHQKRPGVCHQLGNIKHARPNQRTVVGTMSQQQPQHADGANSVFIFGLGYTTIGLANHLSRRGWSVSSHAHTTHINTVLLLAVVALSHMVTSTCSHAPPSCSNSQEAHITISAIFVVAP